MRLILIAVGVALSLPAVAQNTVGTTYYDAIGRPVGSASKSSTGSTYYDATGRAVGSSSNYPAGSSGIPQATPQVSPSVSPFYELNISKPENNQPFRLPGAPSLY